MLFWKCSKNIIAITPSVNVGDKTPMFATNAPVKPAARIPAKVAQFKPNGPGVISAIATMSETSAAFIQPCEIISLDINGIIDTPPKLVKPIFTKLQNISSSKIIF